MPHKASLSSGGKRRSKNSRHTVVCAVVDVGSVPLVLIVSSLTTTPLLPQTIWSLAAQRVYQRSRMASRQIS